MRRHLLIRIKLELTVNRGGDRDRTSSLRVDVAQRECKFLDSETKTRQQNIERRAGNNLLLHTAIENVIMQDDIMGRTRT